MNPYHTHYETLGVEKTASLDEIKQAFRTLSMKTHPDVTRDKSQTERFKVISEAYRVLSNPRERGLYDMELSDTFRYGRNIRHPQYNHNYPTTDRNPFNGFAGSRSPRSGPPPSDGFHGVLERVFHPRTLFLTFTVGLAAMSMVHSYLHRDEERESILRHGGRKAMVEAWNNPRTGHWELPAPWDPFYKQLKPPLHFVPRDQVKSPAKPSASYR
jgi:curved DNA-binding protein CbpA